MLLNMLTSEYVTIDNPLEEGKYLSNLLFFLLLIKDVLKSG